MDPTHLHRKVSTYAMDVRICFSSETVSSEAASSGFADLVVAVVTKKVGKRSVRVGSIDKDSL